MSPFPQFVPVVIVGAGPTGLTCANLLSTYGVDCIVLDKAPGPMNIPRAIVLDDEGARTLQTFGLHQSYVPTTVPGQGSRYYDDAGGCFAETGTGPQNFGFPMRQFIYQPELEAALRGALEQLSTRGLHYGCEVVEIVQNANGATVHCQTADGSAHCIETNWVLACDGGRSPTRERLGISMTGTTYSQDWIVLDTLDDPDQEPVSRFFCSSHRPTVSVPAPRGGRRYEFMLLDGEVHDEMLEPSSLARLLAPYRPYDETKIERKTVYTFHARIAERYRDGRILLLGDAAHLTPPFAGQGMNAGLRDAHNVAWKIAAVEKGHVAPDILNSYEQERKKPAWDMISLAVTMGKFVMPTDAHDIAFRERLLENLAPYPTVRDYLVQMRFKPKPSHAAGLYLGKDNQSFEGSLVGTMVPQPRLQQPTSTLLDDLLGSGFGLLAQDRNGWNAIRRLKTETYFGLPLGKLLLPFPDDEQPPAMDPANTQIARPLRTHRDQILLIRPDRYCAAAFAPQDLIPALDQYARSMGLNQEIEAITVSG